MVSLGAGGGVAAVAWVAGSSWCVLLGWPSRVTGGTTVEDRLCCGGGGGLRWLWQMA